ncbi:MAG: hypothetical protein O2815_10170, partial [Actinomycetota bacterium]|nr:hypothetical protein [Actinomycetota bacterium]
MRPIFLTVHVDQLAGVVTLVAACGHLRGADEVAGEWIQCAEAGKVLATQHSADGSCWDTELAGQPVLSTTVLDPGGSDPSFDIG